MEIPPVFYLIWIRQKNKKYLIADVTSEQVLNASLYASIQDAATTGTDAIRYFFFFVRHSNKSGFCVEKIRGLSRNLRSSFR